MKGYNLFYPFGTDDNGLPTEKLVERLRNVRSKSMSRTQFIELCLKTLKEIRPDFVMDWKDPEQVREYRRESSRNYRKEHKEEINARRRQKHRGNPDQHRDQNRAWLLANPAKRLAINARRREKYHASPEKYIASSVAWARANPEKRRASSIVWAKAHPEKRKFDRHARHIANREKENEQNRAWARANPERFKVSIERWRKANFIKVRAACIAWARDYAIIAKIGVGLAAPS